MSDVLTTRGLAVGYGEKLILTDINLQLHQGEIICLLGANGCGKTTLMKTLLGLLPPKAGEIRIDNTPLRAWSAAGAQYAVFFPGGGYGRTRTQCPSLPVCRPGTR